ncbi:MAG TPA: hypothetical protein VEY71_06185 [Chitinophagales bacterium]|nr:hypothetical protein [Chitinophagales bacterium]
MRKSTLFLLVGLFLSTAWWGCKKYPDTDPMPAISNVPKLELISVVPITVQQLSDSIVFTVRYTDGNGDLGFAHADSMSVELIDMRFPLTMRYHLQPLAPEGSDLILTGLLPIVLDNTILQNQNATQENATFQIRLKDRAGNWSNAVATPAVTVLP